MLITRETVNEYLENFLSSEDRTRLAQYMSQIIDLSWMASIILEYGFQCPESTSKEAKKKFFEVVQKISYARKESKALPVDVSQYYNQPVYQGGKSLTFDDFAVVCDLFHKLVEEDKKVPKDKLIPWLEEAWDAGIHQQRVYNMEIEGGILNEYGIVTAFGAELAMFGDRKGLVPESCLR